MDKKLGETTDCQEPINRLLETLETGIDTDLKVSELKSTYPDCIDSINKTFHSWNELASLTVPEPSDSLRSSLQNMLNDEILNQQAPTIPLTTKKSYTSWLKWAAVLVLGFSIGLLVPSIRYLYRNHLTTKQ